MELEMVICPRCGRPFPKKRQELGYNYCINCSTEDSLASVVETQTDGEDVFVTTRIVTRKEALSLYKAEHSGKIDVNPEEESAPDYSTFEQQDELTSSLSPAEQEAHLAELENEFAGINEHSIEEMERLTPLDPDEDEREETW